MSTLMSYFYNQLDTKLYGHLLFDSDFQRSSVSKQVCS